MKKGVKKIIERLTMEEKYSKALNFLRKENKRYPSDQEILYNLALYTSLNRFLKKTKKNKKYDKIVKDLYQKTIELDKNSSIAELARARIAEETGTLQKALKYYKKAYFKNLSAENALHLGNIYTTLEKYNQALKYLLIAYKKYERNKKYYLAYHITKIYSVLNRTKEMARWAKVYINLLGRLKRYSKRNWYRRTYKEIKRILKTKKDHSININYE